MQTSTNYYNFERHSSDSTCDICLDPENETIDDKIIICDGCNNPTHESCYGKSRFLHLNDILYNSQEEDSDENCVWLCERCEFLYINYFGNNAIEDTSLIAKKFKVMFEKDYQCCFCKDT